MRNSLLGLTLFAVVGLSSCAATEPQATETLVAVTSTVVNVNVVGCEGCTLRLANSVKGRTGSVEAQVINGMARIEVPTKSTPGLTFALAHPDGRSMNGQSSVAVVGYPDIAAGTALSTDDAQSRRQGSVCWIGTNQATVDLRLLAEITQDGQLRARFSPTGEVAGPLVELTQGGYGSDETPDCSQV